MSLTQQELTNKEHFGNELMREAIRLFGKEMDSSRILKRQAGGQYWRWDLWSKTTAPRPSNRSSFPVAPIKNDGRHTVSQLHCHGSYLSGSQDSWMMDFLASGLLWDLIAVNNRNGESILIRESMGTKGSWINKIDLLPANQYSQITLVVQYIQLSS